MDSSTFSSPALPERAMPWHASSQCHIVGLPNLRSAQQFWIPIYFGTNAGWFLMGFIIAQAYIYRTHSKKDHVLFKLLVYLCVFIAVAETASDTFVSYYGMVSGWGDPLVLFEPTNIEKAASDQNNLLPLFDILPAIFVQFFFTWRIWTFSVAVYSRRIKWVVATACLLIILASIVATTSALFLTVEYFLATISNPRLGKLGTIWPVTTIAADVTITVCMMAILLHAKASVYFGQTHDRISRLLRLTIQTGFLTSIIAIPVTRSNQADPAPSIFALPLFLLGRSYTITLLMNLNVSSNFNQNPVTNPATMQLSTISFAAPLPIQNQNDDHHPTSIPRGGAISLVRSFVRTIHNDLISEPQ